MPHELNLDGPLTQALMEKYMNESAPPVQPEKEGVGNLAKSIFAGGLGADMATTILGQAKGWTNEANPLLSWAGKAASPVGAGLELGGVLLANKLLGEKHPKLMKALLIGLGGMHGGAAIHNIGELKKGREAINQQNNPSIPEPAETTFMHPDFFGPNKKY